MYKIGYLDDENREYDNYKIDLAYHKINLVKVDSIATKDQLKDYILREKLDAIIIDYNLSKFSCQELVDGNELVRYLNTEIPDFPTIILTSFANDSRSAKTVINALILDRDIMTNDVDGDMYKGFVDTVVNLISVFKKRLELNVEEYQNLITNRTHQLSFTHVMEQRLLVLYKILYSYDLVDEIDPMLLIPSIGKKLDEVLDSIKRINGE